MLPGAGPRLTRPALEGDGPDRRPVLVADDLAPGARVGRADLRRTLAHAKKTLAARGQASHGPGPGDAASVYGRARLTALKPIAAGNPFWVVRASDEVVHGHSGIFTTYLTDFIRRVMIESNAQHHLQP